MRTATRAIIGFTCFLACIGQIAAQIEARNGKDVHDLRGIITTVGLTSYSPNGVASAFEVDGRIIRLHKDTRIAFSDKKLARPSDLKFGRFVTVRATSSDGESAQADAIVIEKDAREINLRSSLKSILEQADFVNENLLLFRWTGGADDRLSFAVEKTKDGPVVEFQFKAGSKDFKVAHGRLYAIAKNTRWRGAKESPFFNQRGVATSINTAAELQTALEQKPPAGFFPAIMLAGHVPDPIPDLAVPFGMRIVPGRGEPIKDADLKRLAACQNLTHLIIEGSVGGNAVSDAGLKELARAPKLTYLCLYFARVTNPGVKELAHSKSLTALDVIYTPLDEQGLKTLAPLQKLDTLRIQPEGEINDKTLHALREIGLLHALVAARAKDGARPQSADQVIDVKLLDTKITDAGLKDLTIFKNLRALDVGTMMRFYDDFEYNRILFKDYGGGLTDAGLKELVHFKQLSALGLRGTAVTDSGLKDLAPLEGLATLDLGDAKKLTDAGLKHVARCKNLTTLSLDGCKMSDAGLKELTGLTKLTTLDVRATGVTQDGLAVLRKALPNLKHLHFGSRLEKSELGRPDK
jgi:hypothetical protein